MRVTGLRGLHRAVGALAASTDVSLARATVVLVPTRSAAAELRHTLENLWLGDAALPRAAVFPDILTRGDWYHRLAQRTAPALPLLSDIEREVLLGAAARESIAAGCAPPFRMRPALVAEMVRFYDTLRRQQKSVADFERLVLEELEPRSEFDRGAERLLRQTRFLAAAFRLYEQRADALGAADEHALRQRLLDAGPTVRGFRRVVLTMGDRVSDPSAGLYPADFDLLSRIPNVESIDIVATRAALLAGLGERLRGLMPGIEECDWAEEDASPSLSTPPVETDRLYFESRDREEEIRNIARRIKRSLRAHRETSPATPVPRVAVVFRRPLPYVYLGRTTFAAARVQAQVSDALPLAAEPFAAALDLVFSAVTARFARRPLVQLLRSPHFRIEVEGREADPDEITALDRALAEAGYLGDLERLRAFAEAAAKSTRASRVALALGDALAPLSARAHLSEHLARLIAFIRTHERPHAGDEDTRARHLRARGAVLTILEDMRAAAQLHDDPVSRIGDVAASIRRWIESQTFAPARGDGGVRLIDAQSARYGDFDHVHLAGLVAGDWPEPMPRSIFYPPFLLARLGWPAETERLAAERAAFADLLRLPRERVSVSSFTLEDDGIVEPSPLLEDLERAGLPVVPATDGRRARIFADEALASCADEAWHFSAQTAGWAALRASRTPASEAAFHGATQGEGLPAPSPSALHRLRPGPVSRLPVQVFRRNGAATARASAG